MCMAVSCWIMVFASGRKTSDRARMPRQRVPSATRTDALPWAAAAPVPSGWPVLWRRHALPGKASLPQERPPPGDLGLDASAGSHLEIGRSRMGTAALWRGDNGGPQGVLTSGFCRGPRDRSSPSSNPLLEGQNVADFQAAVSQGAGFIQGDGVHMTPWFPALRRI